MWELVLYPRKIYRDSSFPEGKRDLICLLATVILLLALASILVGMTLYGFSFALSLPFWLIIWLGIVLFSWYISSLIEYYLLKVRGEAANLGELLTIYGLAYVSLLPIIIIYTLLEILATILGNMEILTILTIVIGFWRYISFVIYGLQLRYRLSLGERLMLTIVSLLPQVFFFLFIRTI